MIQTLVTGGTGFVGSAIVRALRERQESVVVMSRNPAHVPINRRVPGTVYRQGDVANPEDLKRAADGCNAWINAIGFDNAPFEDPTNGKTYVEIDGEGTQRQMAVAKELGMTRVLYISGLGAGGQKPQPWFRAKDMGEEAVRSTGDSWTMLRPSWLYGPQDKSLNRFRTLARFSPICPVIGSGDQELSPVFIDDLGLAVAKALNNPSTHGQAYDIAGPQTLTMKAILKTLFRAMDVKRWILPTPVEHLKILAQVLEPLPRKIFPLTPNAISFLDMDAKASPSDLEMLLGKQPLSLEEALATYV